MRDAPEEIVIISLVKAREFQSFVCPLRVNHKIWNWATAFVGLSLQVVVTAIPLLVKGSARMNIIVYMSVIKSKREKETEHVNSR